MGATPPDLSKYVLRLSPEEARGTHVLFHTRYATDLSEDRRREVGYTVAYHAAILSALRSLNLKVTPASDPAMLFQELNFDFVYFTQIEGSFHGHEMLIPCIAAFRGVPFLGPPAPLRALSEDKILGKALAKAIGVDVAEHLLIDPLKPTACNLSLPGRWILKPRNGVMSEGVTFVEGETAWPSALASITHPRHGAREFIAEEFVPGLNLAVPVIEGFPPQSFPAFIERGEARNNILTEDGKEGRSDDYVSEPYDGPGAAEALAAAARLAEAMTPFDYARFDFRYDPERKRLVFLEVNMNCAMGPLAVVTRSAAMCGLDYRALAGHVFTHSLRRQLG